MYIYVYIYVIPSTCNWPLSKMQVTLWQLLHRRALFAQRSIRSSMSSQPCRESQPFQVCSPFQSFKCPVASEE